MLQTKCVTLSKFLHHADPKLLSNAVLGDCLPFPGPPGCLLYPPALLSVLNSLLNHVPSFAHPAGFSFPCALTGCETLGQSLYLCA